MSILLVLAVGAWYSVGACTLAQGHLARRLPGWALAAWFFLPYLLLLGGS